MSGGHEHHSEPKKEHGGGTAKSIKWAESAEAAAGVGFFAGASLFKGVEKIVPGIFEKMGAIFANVFKSLYAFIRGLL